MQDPKKKSRLGRGLSSLMSIHGSTTEDSFDASVSSAPVFPSHEPHAQAAVAAPPVPRGTPALLPVDRVDPNPRQPRRTFDDVALADLAASIKANGLIQPIVVKPLGDRYELIAGERRLRAAKLAGLTEIPAFIREADELLQAQMALVENIQRQDLNAIDRAAGYRTLVTELGLTQAELAGRMGEDRSVISNHLRLLELAPDVQARIRNGELTLGHAKVLCGVADPAEQARLADLVVSQSLSVRNLERIITAPATEPAAPKAKPSAHLRDLEVNLAKQLGLRVNIRAGGAKGQGKVVIHYRSLDEFDTLVERMGIRLDE